LFRLGLGRQPSGVDVLNIASKGEPHTTVAINYYLDNYRRNGFHLLVKQYPHSAFIPAFQKGEKKLARRSDVFSNPDWQLLGFSILDPSLRKDAARKLGVRDCPTTTQLVSILIESPPTTKAQAHEWFGILSHQVPGVYSFQYNRYIH